MQSLSCPQAHSLSLWTLAKPWFHQVCIQPDQVRQKKPERQRRAALRRPCRPACAQPQLLQPASSRRCFRLRVHRVRRLPALAPRQQRQRRSWRRHAPWQRASPRRCCHRWAAGWGGLRLPKAQQSQKTQRWTMRRQQQRTWKQMCGWHAGWRLQRCWACRQQVRPAIDLLRICLSTHQDERQKT